MSYQLISAIILFLATTGMITFSYSLVNYKSSKSVLKNVNTVGKTRSLYQNSFTNPILQSRPFLTPLNQIESIEDFEQLDEDDFESSMKGRRGYFQETFLKKNSIGKTLEGSPVLVLNADYTPLSHTPLSLWNWQDALRALFNDKAVVVSEYNILIRSVSYALRLPSVIALKSYHKKPNNVPIMTRRYVFIRDGYKCQYCLKTFPGSSLSLDHVIPRSKGGKLTWTNTVCACFDCNFRKGHMMPEDLHKVGMKLRNLPHAPSYTEIQFKGKNFKKFNYHPDWESYL